MTINDWAKEIHANAVAHGWYNPARSFPEIIALCHSELSEALESYRKDEPDVWEDGVKPEGRAVELADTIIRILDYAGHMGWDMEDIIRRKHEYNKTRPFRHGNKVV